MDKNLEQRSAELIWPRLLEECPNWAVLIPIAIALLVIGLVALFGKERRLAHFLWSLGLVGVIACVYVPLGLLLRQNFSWLIVLVPVLAIALFYAGAMYFADARSIHPLWAGFLGFLRCSVYLILAFIFLLPALQIYEETVTYPKILALKDVSDSMLTRDDIPEPGQDTTKLFNRQQKVIRLLTANTDTKGKPNTPLIEKMVQVAPLTVYRHGSVLDESDVLTIKPGSLPTADQWTQYLIPDKDRIVVPEGLDAKEREELRGKKIDLIDSLKSGTNVGGSALQMLKLENNSYLQAVVLVGDGQSNLGTDEAIKEFLARANNPRQSIPVFAIGVGEFRQPANIRIDDLIAPQITRPDDKFPVKVPVVATGLVDEEFTVTLELAKVKDSSGKEITEPMTIPLESRAGKFVGAGDLAQGTVEFEIDLQEITKIKASTDLAGEMEGTWRFTAKVPRHPREPFDKAEHVSMPVEVQVMKRKLRVLLFAGGATREYQFVRSLFFRESLENRVEMSIFLQNGREDHVDQDVEKDRMLDRFPDHLGEDDGKHLSLNDYDVILAFDPDWTALTPAHMGMVKEWVGNHSGGIVFIAGPVNTFHLARPGGRDLTNLLTILPVTLKDSRLHGLGLPNAGLGHDSSRPYILHFTNAARQFDFLKLDAQGVEPTAGWDKFFWGGPAPIDAGKDLKPRNGFYNYYPIDRIKPGSTTIASFAGPKESRINEGKDEQPYIVSMPYGNGKTIFLGSGEMWRLRRFTGFHEHFWNQIARNVAAGVTQQKKYGRILMARSVQTGVIPIEAQIKGSNLLPLPAENRPTVFVRKIDDKREEKGNKQAFDLRAKPTDGDWQGWFNGNIRILEPGEYELKIPIPGTTTEPLTHMLTVRKPNPETDNVRTNFDQLFQLSSEAGPVLNRLAPEVREEVTRALQRSGKGTSRLFFTLENADALALCLAPQQPKTESVKGPVVDLWDRDFAALPRLIYRYFRGEVVSVGDRDPSTNLPLNAYHLLLGLPLLVGALGGFLLLALRQYGMGAIFAGIGIAMALGVFLFDFLHSGIEWPDVRVDLSFILIVCVALLAIEWLTRKLLRLA